MAEEARYCMSNLGGLQSVPTTCDDATRNLQHNGQNCCHIFQRWHALAMGGQGFIRPQVSLPPSPAHIAVPREQLPSIYDISNASVANAPEYILSTDGTCPGSSTPVNVQVMSGNISIA